MPNIGRLSRDCELCRSRRVKCDLGRPSCQRCVKYGVECPGYRDLSELVFRDGSMGGAKKRKQPAKQSTRRASPLPSETSSTSSPSFMLDQIEADSPEALNRGTQSSSLVQVVPPTLNQHWTSHSVPIILDLYSSLGFIHEVYHAYNQDGPLIWVAHLFTRTYITNLQYPTSASTQSRLDTQRELGTYLGKTLSAVAAAIKTPDGAARDDVLATVWILANYELLVGSLTRIEMSTPWYLHTRGLYSLLKSRGAKQFTDPVGRMGFWPSFNMVQVQALLSNEECPPETEEWLGMIRDTLYDEERFALDVSHFVMRIARCQSRMIQIIYSGDYVTAAEEFDTLLKDIATAEFELDTAYPIGPIENVLDHYMYLMRCSVVIKIHGVVQLFVNFLTHDPNRSIPHETLRAEWTRNLKLIRDAAQEVLDCIPLFIASFATGNAMTALFEGIKTIWPLTSVCVVTGTTPEQKKVAAAFLVQVGQRSGIRQAFNYYEVGSLLPSQARQPLGFT